MSLEFPTEIPSILIFESWYRVPMTWNTVFDSSIKSLLVRNQLRILETYDSIAARADLSVIRDSGWKERYSCVISIRVDIR